MFYGIGVYAFSFAVDLSVFDFVPSHSQFLHNKIF